MQTKYESTTFWISHGYFSSGNTFLKRDTGINAKNGTDDDQGTWK